MLRLFGAGPGKPVAGGQGGRSRDDPRGVDHGLSAETNRIVEKLPAVGIAE